MPVCFVCSTCYASINGLYHHLQIQHPSKLKSVLKCMEEGCLRLMSGWRQFRKHLIKEHHIPAHANLRSLRQEESKSNLDEEMLQNLDPESDDHIEDVVYGSDNMENLSNFKSQFLLLARSFVCKLYANPSLPRNHVQLVVDDMQEMFQEMTSALVPSILEIFKPTDCSFEKIEELHTLFNAVNKPFTEELSTEYRRMKLLKESGEYIEPRYYVVGDRLDDIYRRGEITQERVSVKGKYIPLRETLQKFLSLPHVLEKIHSYIEELKIEKENGILSNFIQGKLWEEKLDNFQGKFVLPLFLYFDEFEVNNPLGSHAGIHKLGAVYYSIPCLPPEFQSSIKNIFLAALFHASDRVSDKDGNHHVFHILIEEMNYLQTEGIKIKIENEDEQTVYIALGLILADNLGFNSALGFSGGFNANFYCRFCKVKKNSCRSLIKEKKSLMRKIRDYAQDVIAGMTLTGISEESVWNLVFFFHVLKNFAVDLMHDLFEGVCKTDMKLILHHYIYVKKLFSLFALNSKLSSFNYTLNGFKNKVPLLKKEEIQNGTFSMSASEMSTFIYVFNFIAGDLMKLDVFSDPVWDFFLTLRQIIDIACAKTIQMECLEMFSFLVQKHHLMRLELFKEDLKPKDHFLVHYARVMKMSGPVSHLSTAKFESKHKILKTIAKSTCSRVSITHTICVKEQLSVCYRFLSKDGLQGKLEIGPGEHFSLSAHLGNYTLENSLPVKFGDSCLAVPWVNCNGILYRLKSWVVVEIHQDNHPSFGCIDAIVCNEKDVCLVCHIFLPEMYDENLNAYLLPSEAVHTKCYELSELVSPFLVLHHILDTGNKYVSVRQLI